MNNNDSLHLIFSYFDARTLINCSFVSRQFHLVAMHDSLWKKLCDEKYSRQKYFHRLKKSTWYETYKYCRGLSILAKDICGDHHSLYELSILTELSHSDMTRANMPKEIRYLTRLEYLSWCGNLVTLPKEIGLLTKLRVLNLNINRIISLPKEFSCLTNLIEFDLSANGLTTIPKEVYSLTRLRILKLIDNNLASIPKEIVQLINLQTLDLAANQLISIPKEIMQLINLQKLILSGNELISIPNEICYLPNLQIIGLIDNNLIKLPEDIYKMPNLRNITCDSYVSIPPKIIKMLHQRIESLDTYGPTMVLLW